MDSQQAGNEANQAGISTFPENTKTDINDVSPAYQAPIKDFSDPVVSNFEPEPLEAKNTEPSTLLATTTDSPVPVVKVLSVRGVEYVMMSLALWFGAGGLIWVLLSLIYGNSGFDALAFPVSLLIVCVPVFSFFFLRLRKQELANPELRLEPSKRRLTQITQILAFLVCLFNVIGFVYMMLAKVGGESKASIPQSIFGLLAILAVAGGILLYYWFDEHRNLGK